MLITVKTLNQQAFTIEVEPIDKVSKLKSEVHSKFEFKDECCPARQKLIYAGHVLEDEKTVSECGIAEGKFVVLMFLNPQNVPVTVESSSQADVVENLEERVGSASASAASTVSEPAWSDVPSSASSSVFGSGSATESQSEYSYHPSASGSEATATSSNQSLLSNSQSALLTGSELDMVVNNIVSMGFTREQAELALGVSYNNPDRALDYLLNDGHQSASNSNVAAERPPISSDSLPQLAVPQQSDDDDPLMTMASQPQFNQIRVMVRDNPALLASFIQQVRLSNPRLFQAINANQARFLQTMNEPLAENVGLGVLGGGAAASGTVYLSQSEHEAVERLMVLGFSESMCIQAYYACDKNEELAANFLLNQESDDM